MRSASACEDTMRPSWTSCAAGDWSGAFRAATGAAARETAAEADWFARTRRAGGHRSLMPRRVAPGAIAVMMIVAPWIAHAQSAVANERQLPGFGPSAAAQRVLERDVISRPDAASARAHARALAREPHVAGTAAQARTRDYVIEQMRRWGLETEVRTYEIWLPHATGVRVWRLVPNSIELALPEPPLAVDPATTLPAYP